MRARDVLTPSARRALKAYAAAGDKTRLKLAKVRRLKRGKVQHWRYDNDPLKLAFNGPVRIAWLKYWDGRSHAADLAIRHQTARATLRDKIGDPHDQRWVDPSLQAADLEAQAVVTALVLRDRIGDDSQFDLLTAAWRKIGLPL